MISIVIPVYKNKEKFLKFFSSNFSFFQNEEILIVNDDPDTNLEQELARFRNITLINNKQNLGFAQAIDKGIRQTKNRYVMLLNSDVILHDQNYQKAIVQLRDDQKIFAISFAQKENNGEIFGKNRIYWEQGFLKHSQAKEMTSGLSAWAEGGACMIDKRKYLEIGGFDKIYSPFYWEDIDLSYRAWKSGYKIYFDQEIIIEHQHETTIGKYFSQSTVKTIAYRNQFLFIWKNITDLKYRIDHFIWLLPILIRYIIKGEIEFIKGFFQALVRISMIKRERLKYIDSVILTELKDGMN